MIPQELKQLARAMLAAIQAEAIYPANHPSRGQALRRLHSLLSQLLQGVGKVRLALIGDEIIYGEQTYSREGILGELGELMEEIDSVSWLCCGVSSAGRLRR